MLRRSNLEPLAINYAQYVKNEVLFVQTLNKYFW